MIPPAVPWLGPEALIFIPESALPAEARPSTLSAITWPWEPPMPLPIGDQELPSHWAM